MLKKIILFIKQKKIIFIGLAFFGLLIWGGTNFLKSRNQVEFETAKAEFQNIKLTVSASGEIKADEEATVRFYTSGRLAWVNFKKGDQVKKWQAIAGLDTKELEKKLKNELLDYMNQRWDFEETQLDTYRDMALTETIRRVKEKSQFNLDKTVLDVEIADIALKYSYVISPIDGIITEITCPHPGININYAVDKIVIANPEKMIFSAVIDEADIGQIKAGQQAEIILDAYPDKPIKSIVSEVDFTSSQTSGGGIGFAVKFQLPGLNENAEFKLGMNGDVEILIQEKPELLVVPFEAVREENDHSYVIVYDGAEFTKREVLPGFSNDTYTEIKSGLENNERVVISGFKQIEKKIKNK